MSTTETYNDPKLFWEAVHGKRERRASNPVRSGATAAQIGAGTIVGRSTRSPATGLSTLLKLGWNVEWNSRMQIRLWKGALDTGYMDDERACCRAATALVCEAM